MQNHGVCLIEQASPRATGLIHRTQPPPRPSAKRSHRHTARTMKGRYAASVPPDPKMAAKIGTVRMRQPSQRSEAGRRAKMSTPVISQAKRSIQSTTAWLKPKARADHGNRNDPAG